MPTNNIDCNCHIKAVEIVIGVHVTPLAINDRHAHIQTSWTKTVLRNYKGARLV